MADAMKSMKEYQQMKKDQTPDLSDKDIWIMKDLLRLARLCTDSMNVCFVVDHVYPIRQGGVHHWCNLSIITASENVLRAKRFDPREGVSLDDYNLAISAYA